MYQLIKASDAVQLDFFIPEVFDKEEVFGWVLKALAASEGREYDMSIPSLGVMARRFSPIYHAGILGRYLAAGIPNTVYFTEQLSLLEELYEQHGTDYFGIMDDPIYRDCVWMTLDDEEHMNLFQLDLSKILELFKVFYINSELPWHSLTLFAPFSLCQPKMRFPVHPYCDVLRPIVFRHMPVVEVW